MQLERAYNEFGIEFWNLYNVDEKGFLMGVSWRDHVVIFRCSDMDREGRVQHTGSGHAAVPQGTTLCFPISAIQFTNYLTDGNRELVTVVDCICADVTAV